jgi:hypothetical protein
VRYGEETAHHILFECEVLGRIHYSGLELETIYQEPIKSLLDQEFFMGFRFLWPRGVDYNMVKLKCSSGVSFLPDFTKMA